MGKRGLSFDEKRLRLLKIFHDKVNIIPVLFLISSYSLKCWIWKKQRNLERKRELCLKASKKFFKA